MLDNKKIFILGMARSGYEACKLLCENNKILVTDSKDQEEERIKELENLGITFIKTNNPEELLDDSYDYLIKNKNIAISREQLLSNIWGYDFFGDDRTVDTHIKMLRNNLGKYRDNIQTVRGIGYKYVEDEE